MFFVIKLLLYTPWKWAITRFDGLYNYLLLRKNHVQYQDFPEILGRMIVVNWGEMRLGRGLRFVNVTRWNMVGIFKPCSIEVKLGARLTIGDDSGMSGVSIYCTRDIEIGRHVKIGANVCIWDTDFHSTDAAERRVDDPAQVPSKPIKIGDDVFIGANSLILKGVTLGDRVVVGAGSVVTRNIPADEIWAGNPARLIRKATPPRSGK
jgi:acetyltransferase-like isoleucine patch superfamily enzyme